MPVSIQENKEALETSKTATVLDYPIRLGSLNDLVDAAFHAPPQAGGIHVVTLNPEMIIKGEESPEFGDILKNADFPLPDGAGVIWALKRQGIQQARIPGIECNRFTEDTIFVGVGGSFDVWTGQIQRAPKLMQALNLEWLWRFTLEPWRIQRSMQPLLQYVWKVLKG